MTMRTTHAVLTLVFVLTVGVTFVAAQVATEESQAVIATEEQDEAQDARPRIRVITIKDIELTDEQEARIAAIRKEYGTKIKDEAEELKKLATEELDKIRNTFTPEQRTKLREIIAERKEFKVESLAHTLANLEALDLTEGELQKIAEIRKEYRPKMEEALKQLDGLLSDDQKKAREEALKANKPRREILQALNLSSEQRSELETIAKDLKDLVGNEAAKIRDVLTKSQRETLQDLRAERREMVRNHLAHQIANLRDLNLTEEQKATLMQVRQEYGPKIQELGNKLRSSITDEVGKVVEVLKPAGLVAERPERVE
jgi:Spy/CpxP family protein refolding chaperone